MKKIKWLTYIGIACFLASGSAFAATPALLKPGDIITITVKGEPELSGDRLIGYDGSINMPLIGSIGVSGMKSTDAAALIKQQLEDGFLKNPVITVTAKSASSSNKKVSSDSLSQMSEDDLTYAVIDKDLSANGDSLVADNDSGYSENALNEEQVLIELRDIVTNDGIANAVLNIGNKVYQTNRLGQILVNKTNGNAIVIADGYKTISGNFNKLLKSGKAGNPSYISLEKIHLNETMLCTVVDSKSHRPIKNAEIYLEGGKILTNSKGEFKISGIKKEYGEVTIKKRGYAVLKKVIDYKGSPVVTFELSK